MRVEGLTGWGTFPVEIREKRNRVAIGYFGLVVTGRSGPPLLRRDSLVAADYPGGTFLEHKGLFFDSASWDGSDLVFPDEYRAYS
jgi:hypothetical protein